MKSCFYYKNIATFLNLCPNVDCPLLLCFKKYWAAFFNKLFQKIYSRMSAHKIARKCKIHDVHFQWVSH